ncbi:MAG: ROK family protein [Actinomycetota bacterium]|nr:ROK family protein [Actinomycetota bacterium]
MKQSGEMDMAGSGEDPEALLGSRGEEHSPAARPYTLAIDIGGTGLKASVLDASGTMVADRVRKATTYPMPPDGESGMVPTLAKLVRNLPRADRISAGFPGMVRKGLVLSAPHFVTEKGPGSPTDDELAKAWDHFDLARGLTDAIGLPTRVANDADVQGLAVVAGSGLELVITLGTGFGTALFLDGQLLPHLEIAHQPFRKGQTYNEQLGEQARKAAGDQRWRRRAMKAFHTLDALFFYDHLYVGGGNATRIKKDDFGDLAKRTSLVDNAAGILGGIKLWEDRHLGL